MMHHNYYFLKQLVAQLQATLPAYELATCFSQNKDELILGMCHPQKPDFYLRAHLQADFACLNTLDDFQRARKNTIELFVELIGKKLLLVQQLQNDRSFLFCFEEDYSLLFKMHGSRSNILLFQGEELLDMFHKKMVKDLQLKPHSLERPLDQSYAAFEAAEGNIPLLFPTFDKVVWQYLEEQGSGQKTLPERWQVLQNTLSILEKPTFYVAWWQGMPLLSLLPLAAMEEARTFTEPLEALNQYYYQYQKVSVLDKEKAEALRLVQKMQQKTHNYLSKTKQKLRDLEGAFSQEQVGHLLMAHLHAIPPKAESVSLPDFYTGDLVHIKLKAELSPQKNAEWYYRKAKNEKIELETLQRNIAQKENELQSYAAHEVALQAISELKELRKYVKAHLQQQNDKEESDFLFKRFDYEGFVVLVGKNAKNNDLLTQRYAYKEDLWLHAKDVTGSHVVLKYRSGKPFPKTVIEKAAQLAAYYSKRKNDSLCPVIVTPRKFVRKSKGMAEGQVQVEKEEVILVKPLIPGV